MSLSDQACASGLESMKNGDLDSAEEYFKEALNRKFDHPKTRYYYGLMLQNRRKDPAAAEQVWKAVSMFQLKSRYHVQVLCNLATLLIEYKKDYDEAEKCFKLALECDPLHVNAMINYGLLLIRRTPESSRDFVKAEQLLAKATRTDPDKIHNVGYLLQELILDHNKRNGIDTSERSSSPSLAKHAAKSNEGSFRKRPV